MCHPYLPGMIRVLLYRGTVQIDREEGLEMEATGAAHRRVHPCAGVCKDQRRKMVLCCKARQFSQPTKAL